MHTTSLSSVVAKTTTWAAQNPVAVRAVLAALPFVAAVVSAVLTSQPVFAAPPCDSGSGCGGG